MRAVSECCGFGYTLHEQLVEAGAHSIITTPMRLNLERRRKNDRMDARELCVRLSRYLDGHGDELKPICIGLTRIRPKFRAMTENFGKLAASPKEICASADWMSDV